MSQKSKSKQETTSGYLPFQTDVANKLTETYSPYIGQGTLGGLSDLEQQSVNMLKSADIWSPLASTAKGLLTGQTGAKPITPELAGTEWGRIERGLTDIERDVAKPARQEAFAGPGYWSSARREGQVGGYGQTGRQSFSDYLGEGYKKFQWDVDQYNRQIEEAKAGRALSALGVTPGALNQWTGTLFGTGQMAREIENAITDPGVLQVLNMILGLGPMGTRTTRGTQTPSEFQQAANWAGVGTLALGALGGLGGADALGSMSNPSSAVSQYSLGGYGGGF